MGKCVRLRIELTVGKGSALVRQGWSFRFPPGRSEGHGGERPRLASGAQQAKILARPERIHQAVPAQDLQ
jgi:hypothetical protein